MFSCCVVSTHRWPKSPPPHFPGPGTNAWLPSLSLTSCFMYVRVSQRPCLIMALPGSMEEKNFPFALTALFVDWALVRVHQMESPGVPWTRESVPPHSTGHCERCPTIPWSLSVPFYPLTTQIITTTPPLWPFGLGLLVLPILVAPVMSEAFATKFLSFKLLMKEAISSHSVKLVHLSFGAVLSRWLSP